MTNHKILFIVTSKSDGWPGDTNKHVITYAFDREDAKRNAVRYLEGNADKYIVTPLTSPGDPIKLDITFL